MEIRYFKDVRNLEALGCKTLRDFEINFIGKVWNFRFGFSQIALWRNCKPVFSLINPLTRIGDGWDD